MTEADKEKLPEYAARPLWYFIGYWQETSTLVDACMDGVSLLVLMPGMVESLAKIPATNERDERAIRSAVGRIDEYKKTAAFAQVELDTDFPRLHAHIIVGAWGALEAAIEDMLVGILLNEPAVLELEALKKLKIPLAEFELLDKEERMRLLVEDMNRGASNKYGIDRFDAVLQIFGLTSPVHAEIKKDFFELNHVRNVIVHRGSVADRKLVSSCPWMGLKVGDHLVVNHNDYLRYGRALVQYAVVVMYRLGEHYNVDVSKTIRISRYESGNEIDVTPSQSK